MKNLNLLAFAFLVLPLSASAEGVAGGGSPPPYCAWEMVDYAIPSPICGLQGDAVRGQQIASDGHKGNCLACHQLPLDGIEAYGTIAPPLAGIGKRLNAGQLRLRVVDSRQLNPGSIMPGFYRNPALINRPAKDYVGRTFLSAQEVEDVIAYLGTLQ